ncbi:heparan sulfate glucosamine 3-O-sulfotransferase 1-like [Saccoglossus kowalevskii]|uniref:Heparan sulfate glucosamine 3-O-sulfotransferase 3B1-like n=1 Tax=Saccoglossus kowalevskii TaxID=10224 RepID=A0ABM0LWT9_SACKO|nr:PREDICTED: heparan sulfate glucosamine 3-O-sulfotransferase 3B1-like [Saccoglossus kowalevskii]
MFNRYLSRYASTPIFTIVGCVIILFVYNHVSLKPCRTDDKFLKNALPVVTTVYTTRPRTTAQTGDGYLPIDVPWTAAHNKDDYVKAKFDKSCYTATLPFHIPKALRNDSELHERDCVQRVPRAIIPGIRKCGTAALQHFLTVHPYITGPILEVHFFDSKGKYNTNGDSEPSYGWYKQQMPYTTVEEIGIEKTPAYVFRPPDLPRRVAEEMPPETVFIVTLCDPVRRAVSDYLEYNRKKTGTEEMMGLHKYVGETFESSVIRNGYLDQLNEFVDMGIYLKHLLRWLDHIPMNRLHVVDGGILAEDPALELRKIETFLGVPHFFRREHFYRNESRGLQCMSFPSTQHCLPLNKGRVHPDVALDVFKQLCDFYRPYNLALENLFRQKFTWTEIC